MKKPRQKTIFKGITLDAKALGVTREHLWRVLTEERVSPTLTKRYSDLKAARGPQP